MFFCGAFDIIWSCSSRKTVKLGDAISDAEIASRQYIETPHTEHQEHMHGPLPNAFDLCEFGDDGFVVK